MLLKYRIFGAIGVLFLTGVVVTNSADARGVNLVNRLTSDTVTFSGRAFLAVPPTATKPGFGTLVAKDCTLRSDHEKSPFSCTLTGTARLTLSGGTLNGSISSRDSVITFSETFVYTSQTTGTGTGPARELDFDDRSSSSGMVAVSFRSVPSGIANIFNDRGTIVVSDTPNQPGDPDSITTPTTIPRTTTTGSTSTTVPTTTTTSGTTTTRPGSTTTLPHPTTTSTSLVTTTVPEGTTIPCPSTTTALDSTTTIPCETTTTSPGDTTTTIPGGTTIPCPTTTTVPESTTNPGDTTTTIPCEPTTTPADTTTTNPGDTTTTILDPCLTTTVPTSTPNPCDTTTTGFPTTTGRPTTSALPTTTVTTIPVLLGAPRGF